MPYGFNPDKSKFDLSLLSEGRKVIFIGDSYQKGTNNNDISFLNYFRDWYGSNFDAIYNNQEGGYGFAKANMQFITLLQSLNGNVGDPYKITDIVVTGGYNDYNNPSGIGSAINTFMNYVKNTYPNAVVWLAPVGWSKNYNATNRSTVRDAIMGWESEGLRYGARVITNIACLFRNPILLLDSDKMHPTDGGHRQLAQLIHQGIMTGSCEVIQGSSNVGYTKASGISNDGLTAVYSYARNGQCVVIHSQRSTIKFSSVKTIKCTGNNADILDLGVVPNCKTLGYAWATPTTVITNGVTINVIMKPNGGSDYVNVSCMLFIRHGHIYLSAFNVPTTGGFQTISTNEMYIPPFEFTVNNFYG